MRVICMATNMSELLRNHKKIIAIISAPIVLVPSFSIEIEPRLHSPFWEVDCSTVIATEYRNHWEYYKLNLTSNQDLTLQSIYTRGNNENFLNISVTYSCIFFFSNSCTTGIFCYYMQLKGNYSYYFTLGVEVCSRNPNWTPSCISQVNAWSIHISNNICKIKFGHSNNNDSQFVEMIHQYWTNYKSERYSCNFYPNLRQ